MTYEKRDCRCPLARHQHGTPAGYAVCGCGCLACRVAYAKQCRDRNAGRRNGVERTWPFVSSVGTRRRLEALHAVGWSGRELAHRLDTTHQHIHRLRTTGKPVMPATAERIAALYDELWNQTPPLSTSGERQAASHVRNLAKRNGWLPPLAWDDDTIDDENASPYITGDTTGDEAIDEIAVERIIGGTLRLPPNGRTIPELLEAVRQLAARGLNDADIGRRVGRSRDAVAKIRERHGIPNTREDTAA